MTKSERPSEGTYSILKSVGVWLKNRVSRQTSLNGSHREPPSILITLGVFLVENTLVYRYFKCIVWKIFKHLISENVKFG